MAETTTAHELCALAQTLLAQPTSQARLAAARRHLQQHGVLAHESGAVADADSFHSSEPLVVHLRGRNPVAVLLAAGADVVDPEPVAADISARVESTRVHELGANGHVRRLYGLGALTAAAPQAIALRVIRELFHLGEDLPGHVIFVIAPGSATGDAAFEAAGRRVRDIVREHRLRPLLALVPGRIQPGISERARHRLVVATGSAGLLCVQLLAVGQTAAPRSYARGLDAAWLLNDALHDLARCDPDAFGRPPHAPPMTVQNWRTGPAPAPGWLPGWAAARVTLATGEPDPGVVLDRLVAGLRDSFERHLSERHRILTNRGHADVADRPDRSRPWARAWQPVAVDYAQMRRSCEGALPPSDAIPAEPAGANATPREHDQALAQMWQVYRHSAYAAAPAVVAALVSPTLPSFALDPDACSAYPALVRTCEEYDVLRTAAGWLGDGWHQLACDADPAKNASTFHDQMPRGAADEASGPRTAWGAWPLVAYGPAGAGEGTAGEFVEVEPSFTRLPEFLRTLTVRVLAEEHRPGLMETTWTTLRRLSTRLGLSRRDAARVDDDGEMYAAGPDADRDAGVAGDHPAEPAGPRQAAPAANDT